MMGEHDRDIPANQLLGDDQRRHQRRGAENQMRSSRASRDPPLTSQSAPCLHLWRVAMR